MKIVSGTAICLMALFTGCAASNPTKSQPDTGSKPSHPPHESVSATNRQSTQIEPYMLSATPLVNPSVVSAVNSQEHKALLDIKSQLQGLQALIRTSQAYQYPDARIKFRYDWLSHDVYKIERGIDDYLANPTNQPRHFEPIVGDYSQ